MVVASYLLLPQALRLLSLSSPCAWHCLSFGMANSGSGSGSSSSSPCGACKFLRRKCVQDCIFAPYFGCEQGAARFAAIHKIFGASNVSKLLLHVPAPGRCEAVVTIAYEAQARIRDPVYGCVAHIFALQQQVAMLQAQLMQLRAQLAHRIVGSRSFVVDQWQQNVETDSTLQPFSNLRSMSPQSSLGSSLDGFLAQEMYYKEEVPAQDCTKKRAPHSELEELQALALKMMRS